MTTPTYDPKITAVLLVDPYNDFLSEGGKLWPRVKPIAEEVGLLDNLRAIMLAAREAGLGIFLVPHRRWEPLQYKGWKIPDPLSTSGDRQPNLRERYVGRHLSRRFPAPTGRYPRQGALGFKWFPKYGFGPSATAPWLRETYRHRDDC